MEDLRVFVLTANDTGSISLIKEFLDISLFWSIRSGYFICHKRMSKRVRVNLLQYVSYRYKKLNKFCMLSIRDQRAERDEIVFRIFTDKNQNKENKNALQIIKTHTFIIENM